MAYWVPDGSGGYTTGNRPVLPGQNYNDWRHNATGETGVYSNWSLQSSTHLLEDVGHPDLPDYPQYSRSRLLSQMYSNEHVYSPMELSRYSHGGQKWSDSFRVNQPWQFHKPWEFNGVPGAEVFHDGDWGYHVDDERSFTFSRHSNWHFYGVDSADATFDGRPRRYWDSADLPSYARLHAPYEYKGVGDDRVEDPGEAITVKYARAESSNEHAFQRTQEWQGVTSAKAL